MSDRLIIIGGGQAAFACAAKLRALSDMRPITIVGAEEAFPYQRPPLSKKYLLGEMSLDRLMFRPAEWYGENNIEIRTGTRVAALDRQAQEIVLVDGSRLATGTSPWQPAPRHGRCQMLSPRVWAAFIPSATMSMPTACVLS